MTDASDLIGIWSADHLYGPAAQSDDVLIFMPDGNGRYEFINFVLCSAELFTWTLIENGLLRLSGVKKLQVSDDTNGVEELPPSLGTEDVSFSISSEDTPLYGRVRVLDISLGWTLERRYGFVRRDTVGFEEPKFTL